MQSQVEAPFKVKLDVGITSKTGDLPKVTTVEFASKQGVFSFPVDGAPLSVMLDPNTTLLMDAGPFTRK